MNINMDVDMNMDMNFNTNINMKMYMNMPTNFSQRSYHSAGMLQQSLPLWDFPYPSRAPSTVGLSWVRVRPASFFTLCWLTHSDDIVWDSRDATAIVVLSELQILLKSGTNHFSLHNMGLSKFPDSLLPVILHFSSDISTEVHWGCAEVPLVLCCHRRFNFITFLIISAFTSRPCHHRPPCNFLNLLNASFGCGKRFQEIVDRSSDREWEGVSRERRTMDRLQLRGGVKRLKPSANM